MPYEPRTYRRAVDAPGLVSYEVIVRETDLLVSTLTDLSDLARALATSARSELEAYIATDPRFAETYAPYPVAVDAPRLVREMAEAAAAAGVGPMAAVAGAVAEYVGRGLLDRSEEVIVENGGDIFLAGGPDRIVAIHAGSSPVTGKVGLSIRASALPVAVCTSSATVGPSVSLGKADAACVVADSGAVADAVASRLGNRIRSREDVAASMQDAIGIEGVRGVVVVVEGNLGAAGDIELVGT